MDIEILLWLQGLREAAGPTVEAVANGITNITTSPLTYAIPFLLYWVFDKRAGQFIMLTYGISSPMNNLIKSTATIQRPWIRDARVMPSELALPDATGYSFPSGHVQTVGSVYGGVGWYYREHRWPLVVGVIITLLVAFTRCFLGVHTPQDVLVGLLVAVVGIWLASRALEYLDKDNFDLRRFLIVGIAATTVMCLYVALKPYPPAVEGADPSVLWLDSFKAIGVFLGIVIGVYLERRYVNFSTDCAVREKVIRVVVSLVVTAALYIACQPLKSAGLNEVYGFLRSALPVMAAVWGGPALTKLIVSKLDAPKAEAE